MCFWTFETKPENCHRGIQFFEGIQNQFKMKFQTNPPSSLRRRDQDHESKSEDYDEFSRMIQKPFRNLTQTQMKAVKK